VDRRTAADGKFPPDHAAGRPPKLTVGERSQLRKLLEMDQHRQPGNCVIALVTARTCGFTRPRAVGSADSDTVESIWRSLTRSISPRSVVSIEAYCTIVRDDFEESNLRVYFEDDRIEWF